MVAGGLGYSLVVVIALFQYSFSFYRYLSLFLRVMQVFL